MAISVKDEDFGFDKFLDSVESLAKMDVEVGYDQTSGSEDGFKIVDLAVTHEFGNDNIPARPFVRGSFDNNQQEIGDTGVKLLVPYLDQKIDGELTLNIWGDSLKSIIQNGVITRSLNLEANAQSTIDRKKGSDTPLIDNGRMIAAIQVKVNR